MAYDLVSMGNSIVDYSYKVDKEFLDKIGIEEGSSQPISYNNRKSLEEMLGSYERYSGGSAANTAAAFANLGGKAAYLGAVGKDDNGKFFKQDMKDSGTKRTFRGIKKKFGRTGVVMNLVTDNDRTMLFDLTNSPTLYPSNISKGAIKNSLCFHTTGYVLDSMDDTLLYALEVAEDYGNFVSMDLGSDFIVKKHKARLWDVIKKNVDILFANEEESMALTGKNPKESALYIAGSIDVAVVKLGKKGSLIAHANHLVHVPAKKVDAINATGAGDSFAAAFIYGFLNQFSLEDCGKAASEYASLVVAQEEARLNFKPEVFK